MLPEQTINPSSRDIQLNAVRNAASGVRNAVGGAAGFDARDPKERLMQELPKLDPTKVVDQQQIVDLVSAVNPAKGMELQTQYSNEAKALTEKDASATAGLNNREAIADKIEAEHPDLAKAVRTGNPESLKAALKIITQNAKPQAAASIGGAQFQKGTTFTVQDAGGTNFTMVAGYDKDAGKVVNTYAALDGSDKQPDGEVVITGGEFGLTAGAEGRRKTGQLGAETAEKQFQIKRAEQLDLLPDLNVSMQKIDRAGELLAGFPTGGPINKFQLGVENFLGKKPADKAEAEIIMGQEMYKTLKPLFGGLISDSESARIEKIYWSMNRGNAANAGIIKELQSQVRNSIMKAELYNNASSAAEYSKMVKQMFPSVSGKTSGTAAKPDYINSIMEQYK